MPTRDPVKNREYVAKHRAMKRENEETRKEYNQLNASYIEKFNNHLKQKLGMEEYHKEKAEYMRQYRAKQKQAKQTIQNKTATTIQSAIRNKLARNALLKQQQQAQNKPALKNKINASSYANNMVDNLISTVVNQQPIKRNRGRPPKQ